MVLKARVNKKYSHKRTGAVIKVSSIKKSKEDRKRYVFYVEDGQKSFSEPSGIS